ncbi:MAG: response regulator [Gammaproteobacteria bacterium]|nr:response regulator [Gammaproteobacteria bacterium]
MTQHLSILYVGGDPAVSVRLDDIGREAGVVADVTTASPPVPRVLLQDAMWDLIVLDAEVFAEVAAGAPVVGMRPTLVLGDEAIAAQALEWGALDVMDLQNMDRVAARLRGLWRARSDRDLMNEALSYLEDSVLIARARGADGFDVMFRNPACSRRTGTSVGDRLMCLTPGPRTDMRKIEEIRHEMTAGHPVRTELLDYRADGEISWIEFSAAPLSQADYWIAVSKDVSRRHESEDRAQKLRDLVMKSQKHENVAILAAGIAHDFNNILTGIVGNAELARMTLPAEHTARTDLDTIIAASQRAAALTRELLDFAGPGKGVLEAVYLNSMVTTMLVILRSQMHKSIIVRKSLRPDVPPIEADPAEVQQIMFNLCLNASEAMVETGGVLSITTDWIDIDEDVRQGFSYGRPQIGRHAVFEVADTGCGMEPNVLLRAFEPFFTTKPDARGIGLGVVLSVVKAYRGAIDIHSVPGEGTTVRVVLPAAAARERRQTPGRHGVQPSSHQAHTVLFVDDEEMLRTLCQRALEPLGYRVLVAADGIEALRIFEENRDRVDLVILDLSMPRMGGEDAFKAIQSVRDDVPVLLCCGYDEASAQRKVSGSTFSGYLPKPFGVDTLINAVRVAISDHSTAIDSMNGNGLR